MNKMKEVAKLLGVEMGEEFSVSNHSETYRFCEKGMQWLTQRGCWEDLLGSLLRALLNGTEKIIKKPWKPVVGNEYYSVDFDKSICFRGWSGGLVDYMLFAFGNCFRTKEEAEAHKDEVVKRLRKIYDEGKPLMGAEECQS